MELKCAVVFTLVSLLSVKATPHGYGVKGGAVARAEAGAAAGAFSGVGLPLSIPSGPGFSGSFSKSSSSSFASSSASSSSSSFSFSGSGTTGYGGNSLGTPGSGGCTGECQGGQSVSNGINDSHGSGSVGNGLQSFSGAKAQAAAGAYTGSLGDSKNEVRGPCTNGVCSGQKSPCEGTNCKDTSESCKSGQCGPKPSSETILPDRDHEGCASGHCDVDSESAPDADSFNCKNGNCNGSNKKTSYVSSNNKNCASGQCDSGLPSSQANNDFSSNNKCKSGKCEDELPAPALGKDYDSNDIPVSVSSTSTSSYNTDHHLSNSPKATTATSQSDGTDCKYGNCASLSPSPYGYPGSNTYNPNQPQTAAPGIASVYKPATHLTAPKQEAACTHPNCNNPRPEEPLLTMPNLTPGQKDCAGGNCDNGPANKYPAPNNGYSQPQNTYFPSGSPSSQCNSPNCYPGKDESKPEKSSQHPSGQKGNGYPSSNCASGNCGFPHNSIPSQSNIPDYTQVQSSSASGNCALGNCGDSASYQPNYDIQVSKIPIHSEGSITTPNCASGNCGKFPVPPVGTGTLKPTIPSHPPPLLCAFGPCDQTDYHTDVPYPRLPSYPQNIQPNRPLICDSGNCPNYPSSSTSPLGSKFPISPGQPFSNGASSCTSGNCGNSPTTSLNCASGNCPNYPSPQSSTGAIGSKFPISSIQPSINSPSCTSGNCGSSPSYQHGSFDSSHFHKPAYSGVNPTASPQPSHAQTGSKYPIPQGQPAISGTPSCTSGNCGIHSANQHGTFSSSGFSKPSYSDANPGSPLQPSPDQTGSKHPIPHEQPSGSGPLGCTSGKCGSSPAYQHSSFGSPGFQNPSYSGAIPAINCASGNCLNYPTPQPSGGPIGSNYPISPEKPSFSGSPGCTSGTCGSNPAYQHGSFGSSGFQNPSYSGANPATTCASGNCATYPTQTGIVASGSKFPSYTGPTGQVASGSTYPSGSGSCISGNCLSHPATPTTSSSASNPSDKFPDYVALGVAGGTKPTNTGLFVPSSIPSIQPGSGSLTSSSSGATGGAHSQSSVISSFNNNKEQVYTGGFGGPPGILKPYEFKAPAPNLASSSKNKAPHCSTGKCDGQSGEDISSNKHDTHTHDSGPCTSGNCGINSGKPHHEQSNVASGAFAGAAATAGSDAAVYTGGFGGPPGILKPYDDGKVGHYAAISGVKHTAALGGHDGHASGNINNAYGVLSGAAAIANAGAFGSGSYGGRHNKAGGCDSGCGASGHGSNSGNFGLAGGNTGLLEKLHDGARSVSSATSAADASSFAVGGSFASSSASAHSVAGSATKGGYGR